MKSLLVLFAVLVGLLPNRTTAQTQTTASFCIGLDVDGTADDWATCNSPELTLNMMQVGVPGFDTIRNGLRVRFAHDGTNIYVLAMVSAPYYFNITAGNVFAHSSAVMWGVGEDATMQNMGGCSVPTPPSGDPFDCEAIENMCAAVDNECDCDTHLVDIWHMESGSPGSIPGVRYPWRGPVVFPNSDGTYETFGYDPTGLGAYQPSVERLFRGNDATSNTDDEFAVHPCLRGDDGSTAAYLSDFRMDSINYGNQFHYAWSHTAINSYMYPFGDQGADGVYIYEFSRPLVTNENTDVQFEVGQTATFAFAFWMPPSLSEGWMDANHYVAPVPFTFGSVMLMPQQDTTNAASAIADTFNAFMLSAVAVTATFVGF